MRGKYKSCILPVVMMFFLILSAESLFTDSDTLFQNASALTREFEENITVESNGFKVLDLSFSAGEELELIFYVEVEQGLPIDVWFVNYANYVRLVDGNEFLFFIDGSQQDVTKATKIVTVNQHDAYALVFANYNNDTVDVYLTYDITVYPEEDTKEETPLWKEYYVMLPLGLIIGILVGFLVFRVAGGPKKGKKKPSKPAKKTPSKKVKKRVPKSASVTPPEKVTEEKTEEARSETEEKASTQFCGNCGKPVETAFCPFCGKGVEKA